MKNNINHSGTNNVAANKQSDTRPYKDGGFAKVVVAFSVAVLILAIVVAVLANELNKKNLILENHYSYALYDASANLDNLEVKLSKFEVSNSDNQKLLLANDIWRQSQNTANDLSALPLDHQSVHNTTRFVNQLGDYSYYLGKKLTKKEKISDAEMKTIEDFRKNCTLMNQEMKALLESMGNNYRIVDHLDKQKALRPAESFSDGFDKMQKELVEYPELIYDGPFSDAQDKKDYKYLAGKEDITVESGAEIVKKLLENYSVSKIDSRGESADADKNAVKFFEYTAHVNGNREIYVQLTKKGGMPVLMSSVRQMGESAIGERAAEARAEEYAKKLGFSDMKAVWIDVNGKAAFVNLAPEKDGVILYPDLVKIKIAMDDGEVLGFEATNYLINHTERAGIKATINGKTAKSMINKKLTVTTARLALIPRDNGKEVLTYEVYCENGGLSYMIYINAYDGAEENILRVIDTDQGRLLE